MTAIAPEVDQSPSLDGIPHGMEDMFMFDDSRNQTTEEILAIIDGHRALNRNAPVILGAELVKLARSEQSSYGLEYVQHDVTVLSRNSTLRRRPVERTSIYTPLNGIDYGFYGKYYGFRVALVGIDGHARTGEHGLPLGHDFDRLWRPFGSLALASH